MQSWRALQDKWSSLSIIVFTNYVTVYWAPYVFFCLWNIRARGNFNCVSCMYVCMYECMFVCNSYLMSTQLDVFCRSLVSYQSLTLFWSWIKAMISEVCHWSRFIVDSWLQSVADPGICDGGDCAMGFKTDDLIQPHNPFLPATLSIHHFRDQTCILNKITYKKLSPWRWGRSPLPPSGTNTNCSKIIFLYSSCFSNLTM
jgi:hypothetical protein